jgi:hypothetical protein
VIEQLALAPNGDVYSIQKQKIVRHTPAKAEVVFKTSDLLQAVWVSPGGVVHAAGTRYHTNRSGVFKSSPLAKITSQGLWGVDDDRLFAAGGHGLCQRRDGKWSWFSDVPQSSYYVLAGTGPTDVYTSAAGDREDGKEALLHYDGKAWNQIDNFEGCGVVSLVCMSKDEVLVLALFNGNSVVYKGNARDGFREIGKLEDGDCGGVGRAGGALYLHAGRRLYRDFVEVTGVDEKLLLKGGQWSLAMASNGTRVVAAGVSTVLVNDGDGFVAWPGVTKQKKA